MIGSATISAASLNAHARTAATATSTANDGELRAERSPVEHRVGPVTHPVGRVVDQCRHDEEQQQLRRVDAEILALDAREQRNARAGTQVREDAAQRSAHAS